jgi:CheY-like chemotaxis protein
MNAQRLESIGILAGGIAHDFNNLLTSILGYIGISKMYLKPEDSKVQEKLSNAETVIDQAKILARQLLTFSKGGSPRKKFISLEPIIKDAARNIIKNKKIKFSHSLPKTLWQVSADADQVQQAIQNMLLNAQEAMPGGGSITVSAANITTPDPDTPSMAHITDGDYVHLVLTDTGTGIAEDDLGKIFDPYFTTKKMGAQKGVGLGLTVCYSIIKKHGGHIDVESTAVGGTTFHIYLPARRASAIVPDKTESEPTAVGGRILLMDDEEQIRTVTGMILERFGFDVALAHDGKEAIEMYRKELAAGKGFDAVILDLTVPSGMGGKQTIGHLLSIDPHVSAIATSGYSDDPVIQDYARYGFKDILVKPYHPEHMQKVLDGIINGVRNKSQGAG